LELLLPNLERKDPRQFFAWPVTDNIAPGYSSIITKPMDFSTMKQKIEENQYRTLHEFAVIHILQLLDKTPVDYTYKPKSIVNV